MSVQRVENQRQSGLYDGVKSAAIGSAIGYASKYALPLTEQEKDADYKAIINNIKNQITRSENEFLETIKSNPQRTLVQDAYINTSKKFIKRNIRAYNYEVKKIRPTAPFVIAGGVAGLVVSFVRNVFDV